jgi:hypothetical protein
MRAAQKPGRFTLTQNECRFLRGTLAGREPKMLETPSSGLLGALRSPAGSQSSGADRRA